MFKQLALAIVSAVVVLALVSDPAPAMTTSQAETLLEFPAVEVYSSNTFLGMGLVIASSEQQSYVVTARHVLHSGLPGDCHVDEAQPSPIGDLAVSGTTSESFSTGDVTVLKEDRCSDLSVLAIGQGNLPIACFESADALATGAPLEAYGEVISTDPATGHPWHVPKIESGSFSGEFGDDRALFIHSIPTEPGYSGAGIIDASTGLFVGIHSAEDRVRMVGFARTADAIQNLLPAGITLVMADTPRDGRCYGNFNNGR